MSSSRKPRATRKPQPQATPNKSVASAASVLVVTLDDLSSLQDETFSLETRDGWQHHYNVTKGRRLAEARGGLFSFAPIESGVTLESLLTTYVGLNVTYALETLTDEDLLRPLLFSTIEGKTQLIDGWHRLFRAVATGKEEMTAFILTAAEAEQILLFRLPPGRGIALEDAPDDGAISGGRDDSSERRRGA